MLVTFYTYLYESRQQQNSAGKATASKHQHWMNRWTYNSPAYQYSSKNKERPRGLDLVSDIPKFFQHACGIKKCLSQGRSLITYGFTGVQRVRKSGWKQKGTFPWNKSCWNIKIQLKHLCTTPCHCRLNPLLFGVIAFSVAPGNLFFDVTTQTVIFPINSNSNFELPKHHLLIVLGGR